MTVTDNPSIMIYVNKVQNRITFKIGTRYHLELSITETKKLLESTKSKISEKKNLKTLPHLEATEIVLIVILLISVILLTTIIGKIQEFCIYFFLINY